MTPTAIYEQQITSYKAELSQVKKQLGNLALLRLLTFVVFLFCIYKFIFAGYEIAWLGAGALILVVFFIALAKYLNTLERQTLLKAQLELNEKEYRLAASGLSAFENGERFTDEQHPFTGDLDVFGHASLYSHMNRTGTQMGAKKLAEALRKPLQQVAAVKDMQQVIRTLMPRLPFRQLFAAQASLTEEKEKDIPELFAWLELPFEFLNNKVLKVLRWLMPALLVGAIAYYIAEGRTFPITIIIVLNLTIVGMYAKLVNTQHALISNKEKVFRKYALLLQLVTQENFEGSGLLQDGHAKAMEANVALKQLAKICNTFDQRLNLVAGILFNAVAMYDIHCMIALERWKRDHRAQVSGWLEVIASMETYNSMATFAYNHPEYIYPEVDDAHAQLVGKGIGHPLIPAEDCVRNDIGIGTPQQFLIITGSNMSGKSTFLRSVGSNLLLSLCGMPVCADTFQCSPMQIMTSMRIKDSIAKHTSYFQAELLRLQQIVEVLKEGGKVFILLDEILKGTNSEDKLTGSRSLIEHFLQYDCLGMIATHDLELGHLEEAYPERIGNYCFESTIKEEQLFFDYRIREGIARNKNATFLMRQMQII